MKQFAGRLHHIFASIRLKTKFRLLFLLGILTVGLTYVFLTAYLVHNYNQLLYVKSADSLGVVIDSISSDLQTVSDLSTMIAANQNVQENLTILNSQSEPLKKKAAIAELNRLFIYYNSLNPYIICIHLDYGENSIISGRRTITEGPVLKEMLKQTAVEADGRSVFLDTDMSNARLACTKLVKKTANFDLRTLGILTIYLDLPSVLDSGKKALSTEINTDLCLYLNQKLLYPEHLPSSLATLDIAGHSPHFWIETAGKAKYFIVQKEMDSFPFTCFMSTDYNHIFNALIRTNMIFGIVLFLVMLLVILASDLLIHNLLKHISLLLKKINHYKGTTMEPMDICYDYSKRKDELGILHNEFDDMILKINGLIEDNYIKQLLIKDSQLKSLEQQINPHFLYNTLNLIGWEAQALEAPNIPTIVDSLSCLLRNILSEKSVEIPLKKELDLVDHYLTIQKIRFSDRLIYERSVPSSLLSVLVPKMSVQPLVENAIKHALEPNPGTCTITVSGYANQNTAFLSVTNTGSFMDTDILDKLRSGSHSPLGFGIGLTNIDSRIRILYGDEFGLRFWQDENVTTVTITLPLSDSPLCPGEHVQQEDTYA